MERCIAHPEREAAAACAACGRPFCEECLEKGHDPPRCLDCAILGAAAETASASAR
ncbi:MAG: rhomboid family intramembrane serine protease, partial [Nitrospirae bacterium]